MRHKVPVLLIAILLFGLLCILGQRYSTYPAVFNFGDSNSDTGSLVASVGYHLNPPNGGTYFKKPHGRFTDGRLVLDFLVNAWRLPFFNPYLDSIGAPSFRNGVNFATAGSTILPANATSLSPFSLELRWINLSDSKLECMSYLELDIKVSNTEYIDPRISILLPRIGYFAQGLYTIDMGKNDLDIALMNDQPDLLFPFILAEFGNGIRRLYDEGARKFWIHSTGLIGCLPSVVAKFPNDKSKLDQSGCVKTYNDAAQRFNLQLHALCQKIRKQCPGVSVTYTDIYKVESILMSTYSRYGFKQPIAACCGYGGLPLSYDVRLKCGETKIYMGRTFTTATCKNPAEYIHWDGNHHTDAANYLLSTMILSGRYSDPHFSDMRNHLCSSLLNSTSIRQM